MRARRVICFLIGVWFGAGVLVAWLAGDSFRSVDRMLMAPSGAAAPLVRAVGPAARDLFRYQAAERNRAMFETWEYVQFAWGTGLFLFILFGSKEGKWPMILVLVMLVVVAVQRVLFTPALSAIGRDLDFAAAGAHPLQRQEVRVIHMAYSAAEGFKWLAGLLLAGKMAFGRSRRSRDSREELDAVDKRYHRHIDR